MITLLILCLVVLVIALLVALLALKNSHRTLRKNEETLRLLLDSAAEAVFCVDADGICTFINQTCLSMLGYTDRKQVLGRNMHQLMHHSHADGTPMPVEECAVHRAFRAGTVMHRDDEVAWRADGTCFPIEYFSHPRLVGGDISGAVVTFMDTIGRKKVEEELRESQKRFQGLVETLYDWVWEVDTQGRYTYVSPQVRNILGYHPDELLGKTPYDLMSPAEAARVAEVFTVLIKDRRPIYGLENINIHKNGGLVVLETNGLPFFDGDGSLIGYRGTDRDITARKQAEDKIRHMADHDFLTDLPTLRLAKDRLLMAINNGRRYKKMVAVMFIDLDGFKPINDALGHDAGDILLKRVAARLVSGVRSTNTVARVGGDEFLFVATELQHRDSVALVAQKVLRLVSLPVSLSDKEVSVTASVGIALYPTDGEDIDVLIKAADAAMYKAKNAGKNGYCFATEGP